MSTLSRRLAALILAGLVAVGNVAICDGWATTAEGRMACCTGDRPCPMHQGRENDTGEKLTLTQAQADACCAFSEQKQSGQSNEAFAAPVSSGVLGAKLVVPPTPPRRVLNDAWRASIPSPSSPIPKHVLLSVFLI